MFWNWNKGIPLSYPYILISLLISGELTEAEAGFGCLFLSPKLLDFAALAVFNSWAKLTFLF
jgi:hypothetical protein